MGPVFDGAGLNFTAMSYRDQVDIGFMACRESVPDLWRLAGEIPEALAELVKLARDVDPAPPTESARAPSRGLLRGSGCR